MSNQKDGNNMRPIFREHLLPIRYVIIFLVLALLPNPTHLEDTCADPSYEPPLDRLVYDDWAFCWSEYQELFAPYFNLQKDDWDEGWGWVHNTNLYKAFSRMVTAGIMLTNGVSDRIQKWWPHRYEGIFNEANPPRGQGRIAAIFSDEATLHLFFRSTANALHHIAVQPYTTSPWPTQYQNITETLGPESPGGLPSITGDPVLVSSPDSRLWVLAAGWDEPDRVLLFKQTVGTSWMVSELTPQPTFNKQFTISAPLIIELSPGLFAVFGVNPDRRLVRYVYNQDFVPSIDLPASDKYMPNLEHSNLAGALIDGAIHVFGIDKDTGHILHFQTNDLDVCGPMTYEDLTTVATGLLYVAHYSHLSVVGDENGRVVVYGRDPGGSLIRLARTKIIITDTTGGVSVEYEWLGENVSLLASIPGAIPATAELPLLQANVSVMRETDTESDIFGVCQGYLCHYTRRPDQGWRKTEIGGGGFTGPRLYGDPLAMIEPNGLQRVISRTEAGQLFVAEYESESASWNAYDLPTNLCLHQEQLPRYSVTGDITTLRSNTNRHIIAWLPLQQSMLSLFDTKAFAWHNSTDYTKWASGSEHGFKYVPQNQWTRDGEGVLGMAYCGAFQDDHVEMWCPSFDRDYNPGERAGVMVHEATHILYGGWDGVWDHHEINNVLKDMWFPYLLGQIPHGTMEGGRAEHKQSMFQIEVMFLADIAEFPEQWVPLEIRDHARSTANSKLGSRFITDPGWRVGQPRPLL